MKLPAIKLLTVHSEKLSKAARRHDAANRGRGGSPTPEHANDARYHCALRAWRAGANIQALIW